MNQDEKDEEKNFLSRWSQRKRKAKLPDADGADVKPADKVETPPAPTFEGAAEEEFDLSSLPKLEDVTETTDITGFLRKGVPEGVRNAALRKSWALDPAIRNYVNPALDYAYDWNTPGGVPGNSELATGTDIAKMVLQIMGSDSVGIAPQEAGTQRSSDAVVAIGEAAGGDAPQNPQPDLPVRQVRLSTPSTASAPASADYQHVEHAPVEIAADAEPSDASAPQQKLRRHGTAKPRV